MDSNNDKTRRFRINRSAIEALISGSLSSTITTVVYQPLELLKTRLQLASQDTQKAQQPKLCGRLTIFAVDITKSGGIKQLWRGTGASLLRSVPGVGIYYALLNVLQTNLSDQTHKPDSPSQAFYFGLAARSLVSFMMLPVSVVKVRYESGRFEYPSLGGAVRSAYTSSNGWTGMAPTILRDSLFSGTYYMCYTKLKSLHRTAETIGENATPRRHAQNLLSGLASGLIASIMTNPIDVVKTHVQATNRGVGVSPIQVIQEISSHGFYRFFDGLLPRSLRRTLVASSTWTFYEMLVGRNQVNLSR